MSYIASQDLSAVFTFLSKCLNRWAQIAGRSIPQGHSAADILAKLYLHSIDTGLQELNYKHVRFVDDYRFFCGSNDEAKAALIDLAKLLRARGLSLNSSKSQIVDTTVAAQRFNGTIPIIEEVRREVVEMITARLGASYLSRGQAESILDKPVDEISIELIEETFDRYFLESDNDGFSPTLFHFLVNRLTAGKSDHGADYCLGLLSSHPEETANILDYVGKVKTFENLDDTIADLLDSKNIQLYPYQTYQVFHWLSELDIKISSRLLSIIRSYGFDRGRTPFVRSVCVKLLGRFGTNSDLQRLEQEYSHATTPLEQCDIICSLQRMERARRNAFLGRVENDNDWTRRAVSLVKSG